MKSAKNYMFLLKNRKYLSTAGGFASRPPPLEQAFEILHPPPRNFWLATPLHSGKTFLNRFDHNKVREVVRQRCIGFGLLFLKNFIYGFARSGPTFTLPTYPLYVGLSPILMWVCCCELDVIITFSNHDIKNLIVMQKAHSNKPTSMWAYSSHKLDMWTG